MIVAEDATGVMPPVSFLMYMLLPSIVSWLVTTYYVQRCWVRDLPLAFAPAALLYMPLFVF